MLQLNEANRLSLVKADWPILVCVLGNFTLLQCGHPVVIPRGGKTESLLAVLAQRYDQCVSRDTLLALLWPNHEPALAGQSLNSLVYSLRKQLGGAIGGASPVLYTDGYYRLNLAAGVGTDLAQFEVLVQQGARQRRCGDEGAAMQSYSSAVALYRGDLWTSADVHAIVEHERLRASYLTLLAVLADYHYARGVWAGSLDYARRLLAGDPCREDAHRLMMRCYVRLGERAQAFRQYQVCRAILSAELDTVPEPATQALYEQVRLDPGAI